VDSGKKLLPYTTQLPFMSRAAGETGKLLPWNAEQPIQNAGNTNPSGSLQLAPQAVAPLENTPAAPPKAQPTGAAGNTDLVSPVAAVDLSPIMGDEMRQLQALLA
jgi:hypothetical protein